MQKEILARRQKFVKKMQSNSAAIFFAAPEVIRSNDSYYPFRQNSDFWYLTGFNEPLAALLIIKDANHQIKTILFHRKKDKSAEIWTGHRMGQDEAISQIQVDETYIFDEISTKLPDLVTGKRVLYHANSGYCYAEKIIHDLTKTRTENNQQLDNPALNIINWQYILHEQRLFKSSAEIDLMRKASKISTDAHIRAMKTCKPGLFEYHLEAEIIHEFGKQGSKSPAYNSIVGNGDNACILHYTNNNNELKAGNLVLIDAGCEYQYYASDITRTFPVDGKFTKPQRDIYDIVLKAQTYAIEHLKPGASIVKVNADIIRIKLSGLLALHILQGDLDQLINQKAHLSFYMHGLSHWLGLDVHDVGDYKKGKNDRVLEPGMVLTVEPGLYIHKNLDVPLIYKGIGVRIEDNIVITEQGNEILTGAAPKTPDDIEALMAENH